MEDHIQPAAVVLLAAVTKTIRICKDRNVLKEYLLEREKEVVTIMVSLLDEEHAPFFAIKEEQWVRIFRPTPQGD